MEFEVEWSVAVLPVAGPKEVIKTDKVFITERGNVADIEFTDSSSGVGEKIKGVVKVVASAGGKGYSGRFNHPTNALVSYTFSAYVPISVVSGLVFRHDNSAEDSGGQWGGPRK